MRTSIWATIALVCGTGASASACFDHDPSESARWFQTPASPPPAPTPSSEGDSAPVQLAGGAAILGLTALGTFLVTPRRDRRRERGIADRMAP